MKKEYWIFPVLVKTTSEDLEKIQTIIHQALEKSGYLTRIGISARINPAYAKGEFIAETPEPTTEAPNQT